MVTVFEGVGEFRLKLGNMEYGMDSNGGGKTEGERHCGGLRDDGEGANFSFRELARSPIGAYVVGTNVNVISYTERRGFNAVLICVLAHGVLCVLHSLFEELVNLVKIDSEMFCA